MKTKYIVLFSALVIGACLVALVFQRTEHSGNGLASSTPPIRDQVVITGQGELSPPSPDHPEKPQSNPMPPRQRDEIQSHPLGRSQTKSTVFSGIAPAISSNPPALPGSLVNRFPNAVVLTTRETPLAQGLSRRETLLQRRGKYPLIRLEERIVQDKKTGLPHVVQAVAMVADHVVVMPLPGENDSSLAAKVAAAGGTIRSKLRMTGNFLVAFPDSNLDTVAKGMERLGTAVRFAEPDYIVFPAAVPNDTRASELWGMHNTGQTGGVTDADIDAREAWDIHQGSRAVVLAVVDTGIDYTHSDLATNVWTNPGEIAGNNIDDDNNGFIDDIHGWDFANNDGDPMDDDGHGTRCAGIIGAVGDNNEGVTGVCWQVSMAGLKFLQAGSGATSDAVEAIAYANKMGFFMTSNSWTGGGFSQALSDVIEASENEGAIFVAAAGNSATDNDSIPNYPSGYAPENIISVAASDHNNQLSVFSSFGAMSVDLAAPGTAILSTLPSQQYGLYDSSSMAAAHVAGVCALLKSYKAELSGPEIKELILRSVDPLAALSGRTVTGGRLNARQALLGAGGLTVSAGDFLASGPIGGPFTPASASYTLANRSDAALNWTASADAGWLNVSAQAGTLAPGASATVSVYVGSLAESTGEGDHTTVLRFTNTTGGQAFNRNARLRVGLRDYFTEAFDTSSIDLDFSSYIFTPTTGRNRYAVQRTTITSFPVDVSAGAPLSIANDGSVSIQLPRSFLFFGQSYSRVFVNANGNLTFSAASAAWGTGITEHFQIPRISMLMTDLVPSSGIVRQYSLTDRMVITFVDVSRYGSTTKSSFQVELFYDGRVRLSYLDIGETHGIVGLSDGAGLQQDFLESDFSAYNPNNSSVTLPVSVSEGAGQLPNVARINLSQPAAAARTATITSLSPGLLTVPATVSIPQGARSALFTITVVDDALLNGSRSGTIRISGVETQPITAIMTVHDDESTAITLSAPATVTEGAGSLTATISIPSAPATDVEVRLHSSNQSELRVPPSATILAGQTTSSFNVRVGNDDSLDGTESVRLDASVAGWTTGSFTVNVLDNDTRSLSLAVPPTLNENDTNIYGIINLGSRVLADVTVELESSNPNVILPPSVIVRAGNNSATFAIVLTDDSSPGGNSSAVISATASSWPNATANISIIDDEPASFRFSTITDQYLRTQFPIVIEALDPTNQVMSSFRGTVAISAISEGGSGGVTPEVSLAFVGGTASMMVQMETQGRSTLSATHSSGGTGTSNSFTVLPSRPDFTTELFGSGNPDDLDFTSFTFRPDGNRYRVARQSNVTAYPRPPKGFGFSMGDDQSTPRTLQQSVPLFGIAYNQIHIGSNGYVTFGDDDTRYVATLDTHFSKPRIAAAFGDLDPRVIYPISGGKIYYEEYADGVVITWDKVPQFGRRTAISSLQLELYFSGVIRITHLDVQMNNYLIGLSPGTGIPPGFFSSDFSAYPESNLVLSAPRTQFVEGDLPILARVSLGHDSGGRVTLSASPTGDFGFPSSIVVPPGNSFSTFSLSPINDNLLEGPQKINLTAAYAGQKSAVLLEIEDDTETALLAVSDAGESTEGGPPVTFTLTSSAPAANAVTVSLSASDPSLLQVPSTVVLPANKRSVTFKGIPLDDQRASGTRTVAVTASVPGWTPGSGGVSISDNDVAQIIIEPVTPATENNASVPIEIWLTSRNDGGTTITLTNSQPARLSVPGEIYLPPGEQAIEITGLTLDDSVSSGDSTLTLSANAIGHVGATTDIMLLEDDANALTVTPISPARARQPFQVILQAVDATGDILRGFNGPITVTALSGSGPVPAEIMRGSMNGGIGTLLMTVNEVATAVTLTFTCNGQSISSNTFAVTAGVVDFYTESFISPKPVDIQNTSFTFTPRPNPVLGHDYDVIKTAISQLPTSPAGGAPLPLAEQSSQAVDLAPGTSVTLFGASYNTVHISDNGFIGFSPGDISTGPSTTVHFAAARISVLFNDLNNGIVSYKNLSDRLAVTWENSKVGTSTAANTFQAELFFDGRIRLSYLKLGGRGTIGLSRGGGTPAGFVEIDFSAYPGAPVIVQQPRDILAAVGGSATFTVAAQGPGLTYQWRKAGSSIPGATNASLKLTSVSATSEGEYDVVVSSATRLEVSSVAMLTTVDPVAIAAPPQSQVVRSGQQVSLSVGLTSTAGATYQWLKNNVSIPGATAAHFGFSAAQLFHGATYSVKVKNPAGSAVASAMLGIVRSASESMIQNVGKTLTLKAPAVGPGLTFGWERDGIPLVDDGRIKGSSKSTLTVAQFGDADVGAYTCTASIGSSRQESGAFDVAIRHIPVVADFAPRPWIVSGDVLAQLFAAHSPVKFGVAGLPPGVKLDAALGQLTGKPTKAGDFQLKITATNAAGTSVVKLASVTVQPLNDYAVGNFEGLVQPNNPALTTNRNGGALRISVTAVGTFTGSVITEGTKVGISGKLNSSTSGAPTLNITNTRGVAFTLSGSITADGLFTGNLVSQTESVATEAGRVGLPVPHPWVGTYNAAFSIDPALAADTAYPQGHGLLVAKIDAAGNVKWAGTLAEGTPITGSSKLGTSLQIPLHHQLYRPGAEAGSMNGWLSLSESGGAKIIQSKPRLDWLVRWRKPQQTAVSRSYRSGFTSHVQSLTGGLYLPAEPVLALTATDPNATLSLTKGNIELNPLAPGGLMQSFNVVSSTLTATPSGANPAQTALSLNPRTGALSGQFVFSDSDPRNPAVLVKRTTKLQGLLIPGRNKALGFFNLAELPTTLQGTTPTTSPTWSGGLSFDPLP